MIKKINVKNTSSSTLDCSIQISQLKQYFFNLLINQNLLQVMIDVNSDSYLLSALETALLYFAQLYPDKKISDQSDMYEIYEATPDGKKLQNQKPFSFDQMLFETQAQYFFLQQKKKQTLITLLKQPLKPQTKVQQKLVDDKMWYDQTPQH